MYQGGTRLRLNQKPSSKSRTEVTLLSESAWGRLNPTLLTDSISLAYTCSCLWSTTEHYHSSSSVVFIDSLPPRLDPRNTQIRYRASEMNSLKYCKADSRLVNSLLFTDLEISLTTPWCILSRIRWLKFTTLASCILQAFLTYSYVLHSTPISTSKSVRNTLLSVIFAETPLYLLFCASAVSSY